MKRLRLSGPLVPALRYKERTVMRQSKRKLKIIGPRNPHRRSCEATPASACARSASSLPTLQCNWMPFPQRSAGNTVFVKGKLASQDLLNSVNTLIGTLEHRLEVNLGGNRSLVRAVNTGEFLQFSASCFGV